MELVEACGGGRAHARRHAAAPLPSAGMRLRELITAGELGAILAASADMRLWRPQSYYDQPGRGTKARDGGGVLLTQGIHTLDLLISASPARRRRRRLCHHDAGAPHGDGGSGIAAAVRWNSGALGTIEATTAAYPGFPERIEIVAENATASIMGTALSVAVARRAAGGVAADATAGGTGADPMAFPRDYHRALIADFLDALDEGRAPAASGAEALKVHRLIDALLASGATGRRERVRAMGGSV